MVLDGFRDWVDFGTREYEGFRGSRGAERMDRFKQVLPSDVNISIVLYCFGGLKNFLTHARFQI